jgi:hypothetical protein
MFGSITKFIHKNNVRQSDRLSTSRALVVLIRKTKIEELRQFRVTKLDFAVNLSLRRPVINYIKKINTPSRFTRKFDRSNSILFISKSGKCKIRIYDKIKEAKKKNEIEGLKGEELNQNLLRFEYSQLHNLKQYRIDPNEQRLTLFQVTRAEFYKKIISLLEKKFGSIRFTQTKGVDGIKSTPQFFDYLTQKGISTLKGEEKVIALVKQLYAENQITKGVHDNIIIRIKNVNQQKFNSKQDSLVLEFQKEFMREIKNLKRSSK